LRAANHEPFRNFPLRPLRPEPFRGNGRILPLLKEVLEHGDTSLGEKMADIHPSPAFRPEDRNRAQVRGVGSSRAGWVAQGPARPGIRCATGCSALPALPALHRRVPEFRIAAWKAGWDVLAPGSLLPSDPFGCVPLFLRLVQCRSPST